MELDIFTDEQKAYYNENIAELNKIKGLLNGVTEKQEDDQLSKDLIEYLLKQEEIIKKNLRPFEEKLDEYNQKKDNIVTENGYMRNDEAMFGELSELRENMKEEASKYNADLGSKSEVDEMFENTDESELAKQFK